ncbi:MAG: hypothetical protein LAQ69_35990 [Acidobacteriia bacterium]|nr:hypothetical protein [Terriglobia bacterium]
MRPVLVVLVSVCILHGVAGAQTGTAAQKTLTNRDVVVLAKAGFSEEFIIDTILSGRSRFDTSAGGLAELSKEGLNERVVRVMAGVGVATAPETAGPPAQPGPSPMEMIVPGTGQKTRVQVVKPSRAGMAIATQTPYYESTSLLFGLFQKKVGVGSVPRLDQIIAPQLGPSSNSYRMMANFPTLVAPAGSAVRDVVIP